MTEREECFVADMMGRQRGLWRRGKAKLSRKVQELLTRKGRARFAEFRPDGWPLCPTCGEDELYSGLMFRWDGEGERPTVDECLAQDFGCYCCGWATADSPPARRGGRSGGMPPKCNRCGEYLTTRPHHCRVEREEQIEQLKRTVDTAVYTAAEALHALKLLGVTEYVRYVDLGSQAACRAELAEELGSLVRVTGEEQIYAELDRRGLR